jgi:hypothetical protein
MGVSGSRAAALEINLDEFEKRLRAAGAQSAGIEDPLSELARLVETSAPAPRPAPPAAAGPGPAPRPAATPRPAAAPGSSPEAPRRLESGVLRPALDEAAVDYPQIEDEPAADLEAYEPVVVPPVDEAAHVVAARPRGWGFRVAALALAGVAMIGAAGFVLRHKVGSLGLSGAPPFIEAAKGPTKVQPPSEDNVSAPSDGATLLRDSAHPAPVKIVTNEEQPVDLAAQTATMAPAAPAQTQTASTDQTAPAPAGPEVIMKNPVETPLVVPSSGAPPAMPSQFPDPKPVRTITLRPDGTPIATTTEAADQPAPAQAAPAPEPAKPVAKAPAEPATPQASTPKIELPTKLNGKSSARVVVGKTDTPQPVADGDAGQPMQLGGPAKQERAVRPKTPEKMAAIEEPAAGADAARAASSGGWAVQLAAPRSEAEAKATAEKLNAKYASALKGAAIGVHKATVKGETIYRLRVSGLSKADAAAMCARLKGDGGECFIAK